MQQPHKQTKRKRSKRQKAAERSRAIGRVLGLISNMNEDLSIPRAAQL